MSSRPALHPDAHTLTLFRILPFGAPRAYSAVTFPANPVNSGYGPALV